jgi:hypothetical protein
MWSRNSADPLARLLFDKYGVHVLSRPRENVKVCDLFAVSGDRVVQTGSLAGFLKAPFDVPPVTNDEALIDIDSTVSNAVSGSAGINFLQGFLALIGVAPLTAVSPALEASKDRTLHFKFGGCTRNYVTDAFELESVLNDVPFDKDTSKMKDEYRYYLATGVHHCTSLIFELAEKNNTKIDLSADVAKIAGAKASLTVDGNRQVTARADRKLAYGVELNELVYNERHQRLGLAEAASDVHIRAGVAALPRAVVGSADGPMTLKLED